MGEYSFNRVSLTFEGQAINMNDYCIQLANMPSTFVFFFGNIDREDKVKASHIDWSVPFAEANQDNYTGLDRYFAYHVAQNKGQS